MKKAIIKLAVNKQFFFVLKKRGKIVATSETYTQKHNAVKTLKNDFPDWIIVDQTVKK